MSTFYRQFLLDDPRALPRAHLAAFGKHPGWNDHIDDLGLDSGSLILAKQTIYLEGLSSQIDAGAWEKLEPGTALEDFDHVFLWQRGLNVLVGAMVASRDGKGRARYPMIVCAQLNGASPARVWSDWWPLVKRAVEDCRATTSAQEVARLLVEARESLRRATAEATPRHGTSSPPPHAAGTLAVHSALGPGDESLFRLLYQIKTRLGTWAPGRVPAKLDGNSVRSVHLRMPQVYPNASDGLQTWSAFFSSQLDPAAPRLFLWPRAGSWFDVIVGRPTGADFFCLRANTNALPCTSDVPFAIEDSFRDLAQIVIDDLAGRASPPRSIFDRAVVKAAALARKNRLGSTSHNRMGRWWLAILVVLLALGAAGYGLRNWYRQQPPETQASLPPEFPLAEPSTSTVGATAAPVPSTAPAATVEPAVSTSMPPTAGTTPAQAWASLCMTYDAWLGSLQEALADPARRERWARNPYLQAHVLAPLDKSRAQLGDLDPRKLAGVTGDLRTLQRSPPSVLQDEDVQRNVLAAAEVVSDVTRAIREWTILAELRQSTEQVRALGWVSIAAGLGFPEKILFNTRLAPTIDHVLASWNTVSTIAQLGTDVLSGLQAIEASGDPALVSVGSSMRARLLATTDTAELERELRTTQTAIAPVSAILAGNDWRSGALAHDRFIRERGEQWGNGRRESEILKRWTTDIAPYILVSKAELPLPPEEWRLLVSPVEQALQRLEAAAGAATTAPYRERLARLVTQWSALRDSKPLRRDFATTQDTADQLATEMQQLATELQDRL